MDKKLIGKAFIKAGEFLGDSPSEQALLTEYQTCQQEVGSRGSFFWVALNIIISINILLLVQVAYNTTKNGLYFNGHFNLLAVPLLGAVMIFIDVVFIKWLERQHYVTKIIYQRMRKIEDATGMHMNWLIHGSDQKHKPREWEDLPYSRKKFIERLVGSYSDFPKNHKRSVGDRLFGPVLIILSIIWIILILTVISMYFFPSIRAWLIN